MPERRIHLEHAYKFYLKENLSIDPIHIPLIEKLIDDPSLVRTSIIRAASNCRDSIITKMLETLSMGLRYSTAMSHDWGLNRRRRGRSSELIKRLVTCLYGRDAVMLVDLHSSLDVISMRSMSIEEYIEWAEANNVDPRVRSYVVEEMFKELE